MSEYSTLKCDGCGLEITELGYARVDLPEGWGRYYEEDHCPTCLADIEASDE